MPRVPIPVSSFEMNTFLQVARRAARVVFLALIWLIGCTPNSKSPPPPPAEEATPQVEIEVRETPDSSRIEETTDSSTTQTI